MKQAVFEIKENKALTGNVFKMVLEGDTSGISAPGQFVNLQIPGRFLRRPISVSDAENGRLTLIYKVVGEGTAEMSAMTAGTKLDTLTGLGNGYDIKDCGDYPLIIGGGAGTPPMYMLAKRLIESGKMPTVILCFNTIDDVFYEEEFKRLGCDVSVVTVDGSYGIKGYVNNALDELSCRINSPKSFTNYYACGAMLMLRLLHGLLEIPGQLSLEERMGCGFGACMGCSIKTKNGSKRVCKDGPIFRSDEVIWED